MRLGEKERNVVFGSPSVATQVQKYLNSLPGKTSTMSEIREFFFDLSKGRVYSTLSSLRAREVVSIEGDVVKLEKTTIRGTDSDKVWRALRIEKIFTIKVISNLTQLPYDTVRRIVRVFVNEGSVKRIGTLDEDNHKAVFAVIEDSVVRPRPNARSKKPLETSKNEQIWKVVVRFKEEGFSLEELIEKLRVKKIVIARADLRKQLSRWVEFEDIAVITPGVGAHQKGKRWAAIVKNRRG